MENNSLAVFEGKNIRRVWHNEEWWFSVVDVIGALTDSIDKKDYWYRLKKSIPFEAFLLGLVLKLIFLILKSISWYVFRHLLLVRNLKRF